MITDHVTASAFCLKLAMQTVIALLLIWQIIKYFALTSKNHHYFKALQHSQPQRLICISEFVVSCLKNVVFHD